MATDFFDRQDEARRRTGWLVFYFLMAVVLIIAAVYGAATAITYAGTEVRGPKPAIFDPIRLAIVAGATSLVIGLGSGAKILSLREGGPAVARMLGGRLVDGTTSDPVEKRLLNVVEEMALASGVPVPPVYLLDEEPGINAFAAGHTPGDAAIGVTRGCVEHLTRDQLQGVIAHEFSHILNGDMRLDLNLIGVLNGILMLAILGEILMRVVGNSPTSRRSRDSEDSKDGSVMVIFLAGVSLFAIGYIGLFFARLIKAAVSRQREFLADASAVQFTRNPEGIAGALKRIGGLAQGSKMEGPNAEQAAHLFFGEGVSAWTDLMATHPPLVDRIRRIDPDFSGKFEFVTEEDRTDLAPEPKKPPKRDPKGIGGMGAILPGVGKIGGGTVLPTAIMVDSVGSPNPEHMAYALKLLASLPKELAESIREPFGAAAVIYALLLDEKEDVRWTQMSILEQQGAPGIASETLRLAPMVASLGPEARVPLVDLAMPALRGLSDSQYQGFRDNIAPLVKADGRISLFEFALQRMLLRNLDRHFLKTPPAAVKYTAIGPIAGPVAVLLSSLARVGQGGDAVIGAFALAIEKLGPEGAALGLLGPDQCSLAGVDQALAVLAATSPAIKKKLLDACVASISADGKMTVHEGELLRSIADSLDCPMPPLMLDAPAMA